MTERARRSWPWTRDTDDETVDVTDQALMQADPSTSMVLLHGSTLRTRYHVSAAPAFMFISLFGMTQDAIAERTDLVDDELGGRNLIPIYLVDEAAFAPLRAEQRLFEYLPPLWQGMQTAPDLDWPFYLRRRYLLLLAKWQPVGRIDFGDIPIWLPKDHDGAQPMDAKTPRS